MRKYFLGIAAGGLLRLLLAAKPYAQCKGGATVLTIYRAVNETNIRAPFEYTVDYVRIWQVCNK